MINLIMKIQLKNDFENIYMHAFISRTENMVVLKFYCQENMTFFNLAIFLNAKFKCMQNVREVRYSKTLYCNCDWHILKNYQEVLMKIYYAAGLKEMAMGSGYRGMTLENAKSFKRTHQFLFQTCKAIAHVMIAQFLSENNSNDLLLVLVVANKLEEMINEKSKLHLI